MKHLELELLAAENVLNTEYSFELAEPNYRACLSLIDSDPSRREEVVGLLTRMYTEKAISDEPLAYLMHVLKWPEIKAWAESELANDPAAIATGAGYENILSAYSESWENKDFYVFGGIE